MAEGSDRVPVRPARDEQAADRALDRLADRAPTRLGATGARRARDVSKPSEQDLETAQDEVVLRRARRVEERR